jgi:hypothetical protein
MNRHPYEDLEVVGFEGLIGKPEVPEVLLPIVAVRNGGPVLVPPYTREPGFVVSTEEVDRTELERGRAEGAFTMLDQPLSARANCCFYVAPGNDRAEYVTTTEAHRRIVEFSAAKRNLGDDFYRRGDLEDALEAYSLAADASEEPDDYARILICNPPPERAQRLRQRITEGGWDVDALVREVRQKASRHCC